MRCISTWVTSQRGTSANRLDALRLRSSPCVYAPREVGKSRSRRPQIVRLVRRWPDGPSGTPWTGQEHCSQTTWQTENGCCWFANRRSQDDQVRQGERCRPRPQHQAILPSRTTQKTGSRLPGWINDLISGIGTQRQ